MRGVEDEGDREGRERWGGREGMRARGGGREKERESKIREVEK